METDTLTAAEADRTVMQMTELRRWAQGDSSLSNRHRQLTLEREAALGRTALILVRRAALQNLLEQERQQYTMELNLIGKAFYKERI